MIIYAIENFAGITPLAIACRAEKHRAFRRMFASSCG